jgi:hypothetical protein
MERVIVIMKITIHVWEIYKKSQGSSIGQSIIIEGSNPFSATNGLVPERSKGVACKANVREFESHLILKHLN